MMQAAEALPAFRAGQGAYGQSRQCFENHLVSFIDSSEAHTMTHSELERELEKRGRELMRQLLQDHLDTRSPGETAGPVVDSDSEQRNNIRNHDRSIKTVFGTLTIERAGYGQEGKNSLHPLDAELNIPKELYSLELRKRVAQEAAKSSFDDTLEHILEVTGVKIPKRQAEELAARAARDFDAFYDTRRIDGSREETPGSLLVLTVDGKGVVMLERDLRETTRKAAQQSRHKKKSRLSQGEKKNSKRMATVASIYTIEPHIRTPEDIALGTKEHVRDGPKPPRPENKRVWASLKKEPEEVIEELFQEAFSRDPEQQKTWVALVDGNKTQIKQLRKQAKKQNCNLHIILDIYHVSEYLWKAGKAFHPESGTKQEAWVGQRLLQVLRGKAGYVAGGIRRSATLQKLSSKSRIPIDKCADYLLNNKAYLHYDRYLCLGLPVATGVIEGACKHLVKKRMEDTGARWSLEGAEAVLKLRALRCSHDFDEYWEFHEKCEYKRNHESLYKNGIVPKTISARHPRKNGRLNKIK